MITSAIFEKRPVSFESPFMEDGAGNLYRLFSSKYTGILYANRISLDAKEFTRDVIISQDLLAKLVPIDQAKYINAAIANAKIELKAELEDALGDPVEKVEILWKPVRCCDEDGIEECVGIEGYSASLGMKTVGNIIENMKEGK